MQKCKKQTSKLYSINEQTKEKLFSLLYTLEDLHQYDETKTGLEIGLLINTLQEQLIKKTEIRQNKNTIKFKTLLAISKDKKCTYTSIQKHVLTSQGKDANKEYKRGYYCTNICDWKYTNLIIKKGKFYRLTSLGKLYLNNPQKANDKIKINKLKVRIEQYIFQANHWFDNSKNVESKQELKELREENYKLSYKLDQIRKACFNAEIV